MASLAQLHITLPDGTIHQMPPGSTGNTLLKRLSLSLAKKALVMEVNGAIWELSRTFTQDAQVTFLTWEEDAGKAAFWHTSAHLLAEALEALYPHIHLGIGPPIANGFYYDVDFGAQPLRSEELPKIEAKVKELLKQKSPVERIVLSKADAIAHFTQHHNPYKLELLEGLADGEITFYRQGNFIDLCKGGHLPDTSYIKAFKLLHIAGAYWRGDSNRKQLTRIYGVSFPKQSQLEAHLHLLAEAQKRDHRKIGKALELYTFSEQVGSGLPLWLPKGAFIRDQLIDFLKKTQIAAGYQPVFTPHIGHKNLYITSGHYEKYKESTFKEIKTPHPTESFLLKPMNCPHHCILYSAMPHSYKALPIRFAEFGTVYRYEQSGELHGLTRVRGFTQDDAHIFCRPDQVKAEFMRVIDLVLYVFQQFGFADFQAQISLRDPKKANEYIGDPALWDKAEKAIIDAVAAKGLKANTVLGEAAFYGPKLDFMVQDALKRSWQLGTVQIDYQLPIRFDLAYIGQDNEKHRPIMIHRAPFGSLERFIAILLEHTIGKLPFWLSPQQVVILPISAHYVAYAQQVAQALAKHGIRVQVDQRDEKVGRKIRDAETRKIPYMLLVGEKEAQHNSVAVRKQGHGQQGNISLTAFIDSLPPISAPHVTLLNLYIAP